MTSVNIRMDADIKRQAIRHQGIPFDIVISQNEKVLIEASKEALASRKRFSDVDAPFDDLHHDDKGTGKGASKADLDI